MALPPSSQTHSLDVHTGHSFDASDASWSNISHTPSFGSRLPHSSPVPPGWHNLAASSSAISSSSSPAPSTPESFSAFTPSSSFSRATSPSNSTASGSSPKSKNATASRRRAKDAHHIPRPRNAFIIFRSVKSAEIKNSGVEHDHRIISKIVGTMWKDADEVDKKPFQDMAKKEADEHKSAHPTYRFNPQQRAEPPKRRKVKRNGETDKRRAKHVAKLLLAGKGGDALKAEVDKFDHDVQEKARHGFGDASVDASDKYTTGVFDVKNWVPPPPPLDASTSSDSSSCGYTPFRSPLLPPATPSELPGLQIPITAPSGPLSPLGLLPNETRAPALGVVPLPDSPEGAYYPSIGGCAQPQSTATFGAMQTHEQGSLELSQMWTPRSAHFLTAAHNHGNYDYQDETFMHGYAAPLDPAIPSMYALSPGAGTELGLFQPQLPKIPYDGNYTLVDPAAMQQQANGWAFPEVQAYQQQQPMGFAPAPGCGPDAMQYAPGTDGMMSNPWAYLQNAEFESQGWTH